VGESLTLEYDKVGDILYITKVAPYREQDTEEIGEDILARLNPATRALEGLEILFWSKRLAAGEKLDLPIMAEMHLATRT
jgi:uncharacterized protein YuzE